MFCSQLEKTSYFDLQKIICKTWQIVNVYYVDKHLGSKLILHVLLSKWRWNMGQVMWNLQNNRKVDCFESSVQIMTWTKK